MKMKLAALATTLLVVGQLQAQFVKNNGQVIDDNGKQRSDVLFTLEADQSRLFFFNNKIVFALHQYAHKENEKSQEFLKKGDLEGAKAASLVISKERIDFEFLGANPHPEIEYGQQRSFRQNFYLAHCPQGIIDVPVFDQVTYKNLYPNIDLVFSTTNGQAKYDIVLHPGAKLSDVRFQYNGAKSLKLDETGLTAETGLFPMTEELPLSFWQDSKEPVEMRYTLLDEHTFGFDAAIGTEIQKTLVIDPVLTWATLLERTIASPSSSIRGNTTTDENGNMYFQINTYSANLPVVNPGAGAYYDATYNPSSGLDIYFAQFDVNRNLVWATYLGGTGNQSNYYDHGIRALNNTLYVCGTTSSTDFPTMNQGGGAYFQTSPGTGDKGFLSKFNSSTGAMIHSTYLLCYSMLSMDVASNGDIAVSSFNYTWSTAPSVMARTGAYNQAAHAGSSDIFLYLFNQNMVQTWGTFIGGTGYEEPMGIRFDNNNNLYLFNRADNSSIPFANPGGGAYFDNTYSDKYDYWIVKFNTAGALVWSTLYGGAGLEGISYSQIEVNTNNDVVLTSTTRSTVMNPLNPGGGAYFQTTPVGLTDGFGGSGTCAGFLMRFNSNGVLQHSTYIGENNTENYIQGQAKGNCGKHYLLFQARNFATTPQAGSYNVSNALTAQYNYMAMEFDANFSVTWSSYVHSDSMIMERIATDLNNGRLYVTGLTRARDFPYTNPGGGAYFDNSFITASPGLAWGIMEFDIGGAPVISVSGGGPATICAGDNITLNASGSGTINWWSAPTGGTLLNTGTSYTFSPGSSTTVYVEAVVGGCPSPRVPQDVTVNAQDNASFNYGAASYCASAGDPTPSITGLAGGTFSSSPAGLSLNSGTGQIDLSASTANSYTITYTTSGACPNSANFGVSIATPPAGTFQYNGGPFCQTGSAAVTFTGGGQAGTFTSTAGLSLNASNGSVNLAASTPNTYTVTNTIPAGACPQVQETATITVLGPDNASFTYGAAAYCASASDPTPSITGVGGGTFSSSPAGLSLNTTTGQVDVSASTPTNYTITYTTSGSCPNSATFNIGIETPPVGTFQYNGGPFCQTGSASVTFTGGGQAGTFTSTAGLSLNASNGSVNLAASTPNTYTVTNTIPAGTCPQVVETADITIQSPDDASFSYPAATYCINSSNEVPTITGAGGGSFSASPGGLSINTTTGEMNFSTSSANTYTVTYTTAGACPASATFDVTVQAAPIATFEYSSSPYCTIGTASVTFTGGGQAGTFTSTAGLTINATTGQVDLSTSTPATYTVTNTIAAATCPQVVETTTITIQTAEDASFTYPANSFCTNDATEMPQITGTAGGSFTATPAGLSINASTGAIDFGSSATGNYTVTYTTAGACPGSATFNLLVGGVPTSPALTLSTAEICEGETVTVDISSPEAGVVYNIYDAASGGNFLGTAPMTLTPSSSGSYFVVATNAQGCVNSGGPAEFQYTVNAAPAISSNGDQTICPGETVAIGVTATGTITWSGGGSGTSINVNPTATTTYTATVVDGNGCENTADVTVTVITVGSIDADTDVATVAQGGSVNIDVLLNDIGGGMPSVVVDATSGTTTVETDGSITYLNGGNSNATDQFTYVICSATCVDICDTAVVYITITKEDDEEVEFIIPEGFTPDGDGTNEFFVIPMLELYPNTQIIIFNRWGAQVYQSDDYQNDWDGRSQSSLNVGGDELPEGTYYYVLTMGGTQEDGIAGTVYKGYIYLKR